MGTLARLLFFIVTCSYPYLYAMEHRSSGPSCRPVLLQVSYKTPHNEQRRAQIKCHSDELYYFTTEEGAVQATEDSSLKIVLLDMKDQFPVERSIMQNVLQGSLALVLSKREGKIENDRDFFRFAVPEQEAAKKTYVAKLAQQLKVAHFLGSSIAKEAYIGVLAHILKETENRQESEALAETIITSLNDKGVEGEISMALGIREKLQQRFLRSFEPFKQRSGCFGQKTFLPVIESPFLAIGNFGSIGWFQENDDHSWTIKQTIEKKHLNPTSLSLSADGNFLAAGGFTNPLLLWKKNEHNNQWEFHQEERGDRAWVHYVSFHPHKDILAVAGNDHLITLWSLRGNIWEESQTLRGHTDLVTKFSFNAQGSHLASGGRDYTVCVWRFDQTTDCWVLDKRLNEPKAIIRGVAWNTTNRLAAVSDDKNIHIWTLSSSTTTQKNNYYNIPTCKKYHHIVFNENTIVAAELASPILDIWNIGGTYHKPMIVKSLSLPREVNGLSFHGRHKTLLVIDKPESLYQFPLYDVEKVQELLEDSKQLSSLKTAAAVWYDLNSHTLVPLDW